MDGTLVTPHSSKRTCVSVQGQSQTNRLGGSRGLDSELILALAITSGGRSGITGNLVMYGKMDQGRVELKRDVIVTSQNCRQC